MKKSICSLILVLMLYIPTFSAKADTKNKVKINVVPYTYGETGKGFILSVKLPDAEGTDKIKTISQEWIKYSNSRMEFVKKEGSSWNIKKPSAPQYVWLANYNKYYNSQLGVTSLVVNFYEYTGELPGKAETRVGLIRNDGTLVEAMDLLSPNQANYVQTAFDKQLQEDLARSNDDLNKKHLSGQTVDLAKGAVFFKEDRLEVQFPTGFLNSKFGRPAVLSLPLDEILKH